MELAYWIFLAVLGFGSHVGKHMVQGNSDGNSLTLYDYFVKNQWKTYMSLIGTTALFVIGLETDNMNAMTAFAVGVMGNSAVDIVGSRANNVTREPDS